MTEAAAEPGPPALAEEASSPSLWNALAMPVLLAAPALYWVVKGTQIARYGGLGLDQAIFQYVAWAARAGHALYGDIHEINLPLTAAVHMVFQALGGSEEWTFRSLDLGVSLAVFAGFGALVPFVFAREPERTPRQRTVRVLECVAYAVAAMVVLQAGYLFFTAWDMAQRDTFGMWLVLPATAVQMLAHTPRESTGKRARLWRQGQLCVAGALGAIACAAKPTFGAFWIIQLGVLVFDDEIPLALGRRLWVFLAGSALGACCILLFLLLYGDPGALWIALTVEIPTIYRFIWAKAPIELFDLPEWAFRARVGAAASLASLLLVGSGMMPRRLLLVSLGPLAALASIVAQHKGFGYHYEPLMLTTLMQWLLACAWLWEQSRRPDPFAKVALLVAPLVAAAAATSVAALAQASPHFAIRRVLDPEDPAHVVGGAAHQSLAPWPDRTVADIDLAAAYLSASTKPSDRIQVYGMDAYVLFRARRLSATPYFYAWDLNLDAALHGGSGGRPDARQRRRIMRIRDLRAAEVLETLRRRPPAKFVFFDGGALLTNKDAVQDLHEHVPALYELVIRRYREEIRFGPYRIWGRR